MAVPPTLVDLCFEEVVVLNLFQVLRSFASHRRPILLLVTALAVGSVSVSLAATTRRAPAPTEGLSVLGRSTSSPVAEAAAHSLIQATANSALFLSRTQRISSASAKVDAHGNRHAAFAFAVPYADHPPAVYVSCPASSPCTEPQQWAGVVLGDGVDEVQLQLTPQGEPRLLIKATSTRYTGGKDYHYAACDGACTNQQAWTLTYVVSSDGTASFDIMDLELPQRSFALDRQGRPRFVYQDRNYRIEPDHYGAYYVACDEGCANTANWRQTRISYEAPYDYEIIDYPSLTFTSQNQPRIFANLFALHPDGSRAPDGFYYLGCDASCDNLTNWKRVYLAPSGSGVYPSPTWDMALNAADQPRVIFFTGHSLSDDNAEQRLWYGECNTDCLTSDQGWQGTSLGLAQGLGESPDLQLDAQGRPRVAWVEGGRVGYSQCDTACLTPTNWQHVEVETAAQWHQAFPQAVPLTCTGDVWTATSPVLALDSAGTAHIAFDIHIDAKCTEQGPGTPTPVYRFNRIWDTVRWVEVGTSGTQPDVTPTTAVPTTATVTMLPTTAVPVETATPTTPEVRYRVSLPAVRR